MEEWNRVLRSTLDASQRAVPVFFRLDADGVDGGGIRPVAALFAAAGVPLDVAMPACTSSASRARRWPPA